MSGGSYDYAYRRVLDFAALLDQGVDNEGHKQPRTELRAQFADHLRDVAEAMLAIEWADSGDCSPGSEDAPILKALGRKATTVIVNGDVDKIEV